MRKRGRRKEGQEKGKWEDVKEDEEGKRVRGRRRWRCRE